MRNKDSIFFRIWDILYPILLYFVISNVAMSMFVVIWQMTGGFSEELYVRQYTLLQTLATIVVFPFLYNFYRKDKLTCTVFHQRLKNEYEEVPKEKKILNGVLTFCCGAMAGVIMNNIIAATGLMEISAGYQRVTQSFFSSSLLVELAGLGILIPAAEELLYRGLVYGRLSNWMALRTAAVVSAFLFGGLHMNIVQFVYAFALGILLTFFLENTYHLYGAILGHVGANVMAILRTELGVLDWMEKNQWTYWGATIAMAGVCISIIQHFRREPNGNYRKRL